MTGTELSLADLFEAFGALRPRDGATAAAILELLHFESAVEVAPPHLFGAWDPAVAPGRAPERTSLPTPPETPTPGVPTSGAEVGSDRGAGVGGPTVAADVRLLARARPEDGPPDWVAGVAPLAPAHESAAPAPPVEPLFAVRQSRGILVASLSTRSHDGPLDLTRLIRQLAGLRPLERMPRLPVPTLRRGVQLLLDLSTAMDPFAADRVELAARIAEIVGGPRVELLTFRGCPTRGVYAVGRRRRLAWRPPSAATPVVVVTTLGIGGPLAGREHGTRAEWLELAGRARAKRCPVVAFVPFAPQRWDPVLARAVTLVHWDRPTTAGAVRRAIGPGHEVR